MDILGKAKELLAAIDSEISGRERQLRSLQTDRKEVARVVAKVSKGQTSRGRGRPSSFVASAKRLLGRKAGKRTRTDWNKVIAKFKGAFTLDDLSKASGKAKPTVNQAVQIMKKAGKIKSTGKRGEYQRAGAAAKAAKPKTKATKKKTTKKKVAKKKVAKKKVAPKVESAVSAAKAEGEGKE